MDLAAHVPGPGAETIALTGKAGPINQANMMATPFDGKLKLNEVSLAGAHKFLNNAALEGSDAMISGSTDLVNCRRQNVGQWFPEDHRCRGAQR